MIFKICSFYIALVVVAVFRRMFETHITLGNISFLLLNLIERLAKTPPPSPVHTVDIYILVQEEWLKLLLRHSSSYLNEL